MAKKVTETGRDKPTGNPSLLIAAVDLPSRHKKHEEALLWSDSPDPALGARANEQARDARANTIQADIELYLTADTAVGTTLLKKLRLSEAVKSRIAQLVQFVAPTVRAGRLHRPGEFAQHYFASSRAEKTSSLVAAIWGLIEFLSAAESINADRLLPNVSGILRHALEQMDEQERKKTIAGLMAYIGELQTAGVLEATPSDRLARVAMLIGEAAALVKARSLGAKSPSEVPKYKDRKPDPLTLKRPTALEWFELQWKPLVDASAATGDDLRREDQQLYGALAVALNRSGKKMSDVLPPSPTRGNKAGALITEDMDGPTRARVRSTLSSRRHRLKHSTDAKPK